jgi:hypothetical protein
MLAALPPCWPPAKDDRQGGRSENWGYGRSEAGVARFSRTGRHRDRLRLDRAGYVEEEYLIEGVATSFRPTSERSPDGRWAVVPRSILRQGHAWVGVSAQKAGIDGGGIVEGAHLKKLSPDRYEPLQHPGDGLVLRHLQPDREGNPCVKRGRTARATGAQLAVGHGSVAVGGVHADIHQCRRSARLILTEDKTDFVRDRNGNALGGCEPYGSMYPPRHSRVSVRRVTYSRLCLAQRPNWAPMHCKRSIQAAARTIWSNSGQRSTGASPKASSWLLIATR